MNEAQVAALEEVRKIIVSVKQTLAVMEGPTTFDRQRLPDLAWAAAFCASVDASVPGPQRRNAAHLLFAIGRAVFDASGRYPP